MSRATQENIRRLLSLTGATHQQLADIAGVGRSAVSHWKSGKAEPRMGHLQKLADYYGITTANLANPDGMKYVHRGVDGRLHDDKAARADDLRAVAREILEGSGEMDAIVARLRVSATNEPPIRLTEDENRLLGMFRMLNQDGQHTIMTTLAAFIQSGIYSI